jgi:hypothetical protein
MRREGHLPRRTRPRKSGCLLQEASPSSPLSSDPTELKRLMMTSFNSALGCMILTKSHHISIVPECMDLADLRRLIEQGQFGHLTSMYPGCGHSVGVSSNKDVEVEDC